MDFLVLSTDDGNCMVEAFELYKEQITPSAQDDKDTELLLDPGQYFENGQTYSFGKKALPQAQSLIYIYLNFSAQLFWSC